MSKLQKQKLLGLLIFTTFMLVFLGIGLGSVQMEEGEILSLERAEQSFLEGNQTVDEVDWFFIFIQGFLVLLILLTLVYILISLFDKEARRRLFATLLRIGLLYFLMLSLLRFQLPASPSDDPLVLQPAFTAEPTSYDDTVAAPEYEAESQPWMLAVTVFGVALTLAAITFIGVRLLANRQTTERPQFQEIAENAQIALEEIEEAELNFNDVITRCYAEMSLALQAEGGIQRSETMTTQEFERELLRKGFPTQPVQQLTQLFEQVRYGAQTPKESEKQIATESLGQIIEFCRGQA